MYEKSCALVTGVVVDCQWSATECFPAHDPSEFRKQPTCFYLFYSTPTGTVGSQGNRRLQATGWWCNARPPRHLACARNTTAVLDKLFVSQYDQTRVFAPRKDGDMNWEVPTPFPAPLFEPLQQFRSEQLCPRSAGPPVLHWPSATQDRASRPAGGGTVPATAAEMIKERAVRNVARIMGICGRKAGWCEGSR